MTKKSIVYLTLISIAIAVPIISSLLSDKISLIVGHIKFNESIQVNSVAQMLTVLFLIATFLERALEVYMITFRKPGEYKYSVTLAPSDIKQGEPKTLDEYKNETSKIALFSALTIGILISMIGIRGIEPFIYLQGTNNWQIFWFRILDIILTGGVIAGGSDFIHTMLQVITTFFDNITVANKSTEADTNAAIAASKAKELHSQADEAEAKARLVQAQGINQT
jgi:membrane protease YdiL (CAAX protease family)